MHTFETLLSPEHLFLMTNALADLDQWIQDMVAGISHQRTRTNLSDFNEIQNRLKCWLLDLVGLAYMHTAVEAFVDRYATSLFGFKRRCQSAYLISVEVSQISPDEKLDCWATVEQLDPCSRC